MDLLDFVEYELMPSLFENLDRMLPEFAFKQKGGHWVSQSTWRPDHREGKSKEKVYVYQNRPGLLLCYTSSPSKSILKYLMERDQKEFKQIVQELASEAQLQLPDLKPEEVEQVQVRASEREIWASADYFFQQQLRNSMGQEVRDYLRQRGFPKNSWEKHGLGYFLGKAALKTFLEGYDFPQDLLQKVVASFPAQGEFELSIPVHDRLGRTSGFILRSIEEAPQKGKYRYTKGYTKGKQLFNFPLNPSTKVYVVEGQMDALLMEAHDYESAVAIGGNRISAEQIYQLRQVKAEQIILVLDGDKGGKEGTLHFVEQWLQEKQDFAPQLLIAELPQEMDPGELLKTQRQDEFQKALQQALPLYHFLFEQAAQKTKAQSDNPNNWGYADIEYFNDQVVRSAARLNNPYDKRRLIDLYMEEAGQQLGVSEESLIAAEQRLRKQEERQSETRNLQELTREIAQLLQKEGPGALNKARDALKGGLQQGVHAEVFDKLHPYSQQSFLQDIQTIQDDLKTGLRGLDQIFSIPTSAITLIAARPGHGKTTLMLNLFLNQVELYPDRQFFFFTYEEPRSNIILKLLLRLCKERHNYSTTYEGLVHYLQNGKQDRPEIEKAREHLFDLLDAGRMQIFEHPFEARELIDANALLCAERKMGAIYIDYIQKIPLEGGKTGYEVLKEISSILLHDLAIKQGLPVVLGAQLNRMGEADSVRKLSPAMLREAGDLEQDANTILMLHNSTLEKMQTGSESSIRVNTSTLEAQTKKRRNGVNGGYTELYLHGEEKLITDSGEHYMN